MRGTEPLRQRLRTRGIAAGDGRDEAVLGIHERGNDVFTRDLGGGQDTPAKHASSLSIVVAGEV